MIKRKVQIHRIGKIKVQIKIEKSKLELGRKKNRGQKDSCRPKQINGDQSQAHSMAL